MFMDIFMVLVLSKDGTTRIRSTHSSVTNAGQHTNLEMHSGNGKDQS
jgi:hypothetical protein